MAQCETCCIDVDEPYRKQTLRNRCRIASPNGSLSLTVPVVKFVPYHTPMRDIRISDHGNWRHLHWNALTSSYRRTPFFEFYADDFVPFYEKKWEFLVDYNEALQRMVCELLDIDTVMCRAEDYCPSSPNITVPRSETQYSSGNNHDDVSTDAIVIPACKPYYQIFSDRNGFMPDLSVVDLLFNMGPESILYLNDLKVPNAPQTHGNNNT